MLPEASRRNATRRDSDLMPMKVKGELLPSGPILVLGMPSPGTPESVGMAGPRVVPTLICSNEAGVLQLVCESVKELIVLCTEGAGAASAGIDASSANSV